MKTPTLPYRGARFPDALNSTMSPNTVMYFSGTESTWGLVMQNQREKKITGALSDLGTTNVPFPSPLTEAYFPLVFWVPYMSSAAGTATTTVVRV